MSLLLHNFTCRIQQINFDKLQSILQRRFNKQFYTSERTFNVQLYTFERTFNKQFYTSERTFNVKLYTFERTFYVQFTNLSRDFTNMPTFSKINDAMIAILALGNQMIHWRNAPCLLDARR